MRRKIAHLTLVATLSGGLILSATAATVHPDGTHLAGVICCAMR